MVTEYAQKLLEKGVDAMKVELLVADLLQYGEEVPIRFFHLQHYPVDADDGGVFVFAGRAHAHGGHC